MSGKDDQLVGAFPFIPIQERAQKKRLAILESGRILFMEYGYDQTTAKDIASHAGVAIGTFYRYFNDKRQLLLSIFGEHLEKLMPPVPDWFKKNPEQFLALLLEKHYERLDGVGIDRVIPELLLKDPEIYELLLEARKNLYAKIRTGLELAKKNGLTWEDLDLDMVTWTIITMIENGRNKEEYVGKPLDYVEMAKVICRLVFLPEIIIRLQNENRQQF